MSTVHTSLGLGHKVFESHTTPQHLLARPLCPTELARSARAQGKNRASVTVEAGLFDRAGRVARGNVNYTGDQIVRQLEDPNKLLDTIVSDIQADLMKMRQASAEVMTTQKLLEAKYKKAKAAADEWYGRAELALRNGKEDLAREALERRQSNQVTANQLKVQLDQHVKATDQLRSNISILDGKLTEAKQKKATLKARALSAQSTLQVNADLKNMMKGLQFTGSSALAAIDRMEEKVLALEAEAESTAQLSVSSALEAAFVNLERGTGAINDDLEKLKADMRQQGQLPASSRKFLEFGQQDTPRF